MKETLVIDDLVHEHQLHQSGAVLELLMEEARLHPGDDSYDIAVHGIDALVREIVSKDRLTERLDKHLVDQMICELDQKIGRQLDCILHHSEFQSKESAWRSLKFLVDRTDFRENTKVSVLSVSKEDLLDDFENSSEVMASGLYQHVYADGYGQFGGEPVGVMVSNYSFGPGAKDIKLLQYVSAVGAMAHSPFLGAAAPEMFGVSSYSALPHVKELSAVYEGPQFRKWNSLRESEDARYIGLTGPRHLLRAPYDAAEKDVQSFSYSEDVSGNHDDYLWGNTSFVLATRITDSFARYRWCPNIVGPLSGGSVDDLPVHYFEAMGQIESKIPTEVLITDRREYEMAEMGFISLTMRKGSDSAAFFSANSIQKPRRFPATREGKMAETNYRLGTQLPYVFIISRLAHYLKVLQREQIGTWKEREELQRELNTWLKQYVADQENPPADVRSRKPMRAASVEVSEVPGETGWYQVALKVRPHFKYMGASFELALVGKLDKKAEQ